MKNLTDHHITLQFDSYFYALLAAALVIIAIILVSFLCFYITRRIILETVERLSNTGKYKWLKSAYKHRVFHRLSLLVPATIFYLSTPLLANITFTWISILAKPFAVLASCYIVIVSGLVISGFLNSLEDSYNYFEFSKIKPIKSYIQVAKIILFLFSAILVISFILNQSPVYLFTGLGAVTALFILIFKDSMLGFITTIQLAAHDMVRLEDWIEIPNFGVDGHVIDISLHTIKVQNFDKTIVMIPTHALLNTAIKNWRGMSESGGRRIKRSVFIDVNAIKFCDEDFYKKLHTVSFFQNFSFESNEKNITNLGLFRQHLEYYLASHPAVHKNMDLLVREREANNKGIPLELYFFTHNTDWKTYESIQADIFEHIYALLPLFDLKAVPGT